MLPACRWCCWLFTIIIQHHTLFCALLLAFGTLDWGPTNFFSAWVLLLLFAIHGPAVTFVDGVCSHVLGVCTARLAVLLWDGMLVFEKTFVSNKM